MLVKVVCGVLCLFLSFFLSPGTCRPKSEAGCRLPAALRGVKRVAFRGFSAAGDADIGCAQAPRRADSVARVNASRGRRVSGHRKAEPTEAALAVEPAADLVCGLVEQEYLAGVLTTFGLAAPNEHCRACVSKRVKAATVAVL